jgi:heat-inducible transcriptional repressor
MISDRQQQILEYVIKDYVKNAEPVSSGRICDLYGLDCSSATIRNELNHLTQKGFLNQPHTSGGRVPTDKAYRYLVDTLMGDNELSLTEQKKLQKEYIKLKAEYKRLAKLSSRLLSRFTSGVAVGGDLEGSDAYESGISRLLKEPEYTNMENVSEVVELIEYFDEHLKDLSTQLQDNQPKVLIGKENQLVTVKGHSIIVSGYESEEGQKGVLALIGPKRMNYQKNLALIKGIIKSITSKRLFSVIIINAGVLLIIR